MRARELLLGDERYSICALNKDPELARQHRGFFLCASLCHDVKNSEGDENRMLLGDPMEVALIEMARSGLARLPTCQRLDEISFDSDRMRQSVVCAMPEGPVLYCKGAPESVLKLCNSMLVGEQLRSLSAMTRARTTMYSSMRTHESVRRYGCTISIATIFTRRQLCRECDFAPTILHEQR